MRTDEFSKRADERLKLLGLSRGRAREMVRDRVPCRMRGKDYRDPLTIGRSFIASAVLLEDVLHETYAGMASVGCGRRFLVNLILRAVLAGQCDALDASGDSGDFPPRSWMNVHRADEVLAVQTLALDGMTKSRRKMRALRSRLNMVSTPVLQALSSNVVEIRRASRKAAEAGDVFTGIRGIMDDLHDAMNYRDRHRLMQNRGYRDAYRRSSEFYLAISDHESKVLAQRVRRQKGHRDYSVLQHCLQDLRRAMDPGRTSWYRRPTDPDWTEGLSENGRTVQLPVRKGILKRHGLKELPGLSGPVKGSDWRKIRTEYTVAEARESTGG